MGGDSHIKTENATQKAAITGVAVICEMLTGGLFLENVKMEKQRTSDGYGPIMSRTLRQGLRGFWAGFWPWGCVLGLSKGTVLGGARAFFLNRFLALEWSKGSADIASGFCAGGVQGIFMSPILLARTRVNRFLTERIQSSGQQRIETSLFEEMRLSTTILNRAVQEEGVMVLCKGMGTMVPKRMLDWGTRFLFMKGLRDALYQQKGKDYKMTELEDLGIAFVGGTASVAITMPVDRLMPVIQGIDRGQSAFKVLQGKFRTEGFSTLFRGGIIRAVHCGWHTTWAIYVSNRLYRYFE